MLGMAEPEPGRSGGMLLRAAHIFVDVVGDTEMETENVMDETLPRSVNKRFS